jgi:hypothetical protein
MVPPSIHLIINTGLIYHDEVAIVAPKKHAAIFALV